MTDKFIRFEDDEAANMLAVLAKEDKRSEGNTTAFLIRQEYTRRQVKTAFSPEPCESLVETVANARDAQKRVVAIGNNDVMVVDPEFASKGMGQ